MGKDGHYMRYDSVCHLVETDERDLPGAEKAMNKAATKEVDGTKKALDKAKPEGIFSVSKVRSTVCCDECGKPRLIYADKKRESDKLLPNLEAYLEDIQYQCGDALFDFDDPTNEETALQKTFFIKERRTCKDYIEEHFFNTYGTRGRAEFEHVCAICGKGPDESPLDVTPDGATGARTALPICADCKADGKPPVLVGKADVMESAAEKRNAKEDARKEKETAKAAKKTDVSPAAGNPTGGAAGISKRKQKPVPPPLENLILEALPVLFNRLGEQEEKAITRSVLRAKVRTHPLPV